MRYKRYMCYKKKAFVADVARVADITEEMGNSSNQGLTGVAAARYQQSMV